MEAGYEAEKQQAIAELEEIKNGYKSSHWMWFIFPQLNGLGFSYMAKFYGIKCLNEVQQYLEHQAFGFLLILKIVSVHEATFLPLGSVTSIELW